MSEPFYAQPELAPNDKIHFVEYHRPALKSGDYQLKIQQSIALKDKITLETIGDRTVKFAVQGERFSIKSSEIHNLYPPENSNGIFHRVLPHIAFNRTTLPWERTPNGGLKDEILSPSWMALLLFTEDELKTAQQKNLTVKTLQEESAEPYWKPLYAETGQQADEVVSIIDLPWKTLKSVIPTYSDLRMMAHVRQVESVSKTTPKSEVAIIISNRLPPLDKNCTVHLVSLEDRYKPFVVEEHADAFNTLQEHGYDLLDLRAPSTEAQTALVKILKPFASDTQITELQLESGTPPKYLKPLEKEFTPLKEKPARVTDREWTQQTVERTCKYLMQLAGGITVSSEQPETEFELYSKKLNCFLHISIEQAIVFIEGRSVASLRAIISIRPKNDASDIITEDTPSFPEDIGDSADLIHQWIKEGFFGNGEQLDDTVTELYLDPAPRSGESGKTEVVYALGQTKVVLEEETLSNLQQRYPELNDDKTAFGSTIPIEHYLQPLFSDYWQARYEEKYRAAFTVLVALQIEETEHVVSLEIDLERRRFITDNGKKDEDDDTDLPKNAVTASIQRSQEPLMVFDRGPSNATSIRLVSLKQWKFHCEAQHRDFLGLLQGVNRIDLSAYYQTMNQPNLSQDYTPNSSKQKVAHLIPRGVYCEPDDPTNLNGQGENPQADRAEDLADGYRAAGYVPTPHYLRQGGQTISWYRGPLVPHENAVYSDQYPIKFPARHADELLLFNPELGLFDASYGAAWELGRLLAIADQSFASSLYQWKKAHPDNLRNVIHNIDSAYLPVRDSAPTFRVLPTEVQKWLNLLTQLKQVPLNYLIPDEALLPPESIRYFVVDPLWLESLQDGALSIGRVISADHRADQKHRQQLPNFPLISGVLLRSSVVSGWPHLGVTGYPDFEDPREDQSTWEKEEYLPSLEKLDSLKILRQDHLGPDLLLVLFYDSAQDEDGVYRNRRLRYVDFHPRPEIMHFGLEEPENTEGNDAIANKDLTKFLRTMNGEPLYVEEPSEEIEEQSEEIEEQPKDPNKQSASRAEISNLTMWRQENPEKGILSLVHLSEMIADQVLSNENLPSSFFSAANFALQMLDSPPLVRFKCPD